MRNRIRRRSVKSYRRKYINFDEDTNALDYLDKACEFIARTSKKPSDWKWVVLTLHGALYSFAIAALHGTNNQRVTYKLKDGREKLIRLEDAIERCQDRRWMEMTVFSKPLILTESQAASIQQLKMHFRDNFEHFVPKTWYIEIHGFPRIAIDVLEVVKFLALHTGNYIMLKPQQKKHISAIVSRSQRLLRRSRLFTESERLQQSIAKST